MTTAEEKEILSLLCKVHELEIDKVSFRQAIVKCETCFREALSEKTLFREANCAKHY